LISAPNSPHAEQHVLWQLMWHSVSKECGRSGEPAGRSSSAMPSPVRQPKENDNVRAVSSGSVRLWLWTSPGAASQAAQWEESTCQCRRGGSHPRVGKTPWRRNWQPTPGFFPGKSHGQRRLGGYSPWRCKESDMNERLNIYIYIYLYTHTYIFEFLAGKYM